jgi:rare lipoprotein A
MPTLVAAFLLALVPVSAQDTKATMTTSFYTDRLNGHRTASGERFHNGRLTAAHKTLPLGTRLRLRNLRNGRRVVVRVNDRGPNIEGRELSITRQAARRLGFTRKGVAELEVTELGRRSRP